ncbi:hypothetical protein HMPREF0493_1655 [Lactobacillus amylolyticus DSM 11664]|uniref:Uncharacterized protein n=1 Tax=Lactobacillus amylolyticus DSM 11664 TaxID=585524 RepID=D4YVU4_9LACO|nr:hypothetical protein HMPREF0493_1655 [Lactobacillus amylolyticus DSM 11664]
MRNKSAFQKFFIECGESGKFSCIKAQQLLMFFIWVAKIHNQHKAHNMFIINSEKQSIVERRRMHDR